MRATPPRRRLAPTPKTHRPGRPSPSCERCAALGARPWEHFAAIAFLGEGLSQLNGYAYVADQAPFPAGADDFGLHADLRRLQEATTGPEGQRWDVAVVQVEAATGRFRVRYVYAPESLDWRVTPATFRRIAESARPTSADFD